MCDSHQEVAENSLNLAKTYATEKNFGRAFCHYLVALKLRSDWKDLIKDEFCIILCKWGTFLEEKQKLQDLFQCYEQALEIFPNNEVILNNLGAHLLRQLKSPLLFYTLKMWLKTFKKHFPNSNWRKHCFKIIFNVMAVFKGLKPSFLWDIGDTVTPMQIFSFITDLKSFALNNEDVQLIIIENDILLCNITLCLKNLSFKRFFVEIHKESCTLATSKNRKDIQDLIELLQNKFMTNDKIDMWYLNAKDIVCPSSLFGLLLNYPFVYYFQNDYQPFSISLKLYSVSCQFHFKNIAGVFQIFSFSLPTNLVNDETEKCVAKWFSCLELPNTNIFSNLRCHLLKEATYYFRQCLKIKPNYLQALYNLENVSNLAVERWHFRMLNDNYRNEAFREAILKKIKQGFNEVLDIGTGTGLLSLFCVEGKAKAIYACDSSATIIEIAKEVFKKNCAEKVKLIEKHSSKIEIPQDIPKKVTLLVTETFDSGLLGEDILHTLSYAWSNLIQCPISELQNCNKKVGIVIPFGARIFITGIECDFISKNTYLNKTNNLFSLDFLNPVFKNDNYDTQDLKMVNYRSLTVTEQIININFNDPKLIESIIQGNQDMKLKLKCIENGRLDCFAVWFELLLDEEIVLNTGPKSFINTAWDQAIFHLQNYVFLEKNQEIYVNISYLNGKLNVTLCEEEKKKCFLSENIVKLLNNVKLIEALEEVRYKLMNEFNRSLCIMDWFPFPVFGFKFLLERKKNFKDYLTCFVTSEEDREFIKLLARHYDLEDRIKVLIDSDFEKNISEYNKFDIILLRCINWSGEIEENCFIHLPLLKSLLNIHGIILPAKITVFGQLIYSDWLLQASKVLNNNVTCGYKIAEFINLYQVQHFINLEPEIPKTALSDCIELCNLYEENIEREITFKYNSLSCTVSAMIYWYEIQFMEKSKRFNTKDRDSFFHLSAFLFPDTEVDSEVKCIVIYNKGLLRVKLKNFNQKN